MRKFVRLQSGAIIFVTRVNEVFGVMYGYNLASPYLRNNIYPLSLQDERWKEDQGQIRDSISIVGYHVTDSKHHSAQATKKRIRAVTAAIILVEPPPMKFLT